VGPDAEFAHTTHAISPEAVLATYVRVRGEAPPRSVILCVRGESFELGEPLSPAAVANVEAAWPRLLELCGGAGLAPKDGRPAYSAT
jgi:Ni,Fe-hydrogenase maturation factor